MYSKKICKLVKLHWEICELVSLVPSYILAWCSIASHENKAGDIDSMRSEPYGYTYAKYDHNQLHFHVFRLQKALRY